MQGRTLGVRYHEFDSVFEVQNYYKSYLSKLDGLSLTETELLEMRDEARKAFQLNINLNQEFDKLPEILALSSTVSKL